MIVLKLNPFEVMTLSSHSKIPVRENSPLIGHYAMEMIDFDHESYKAAYESFIENGFLVPEAEDYTLANEMESLMLLLNRPEVTVSIKRIREVFINEVDICFNKGFALHYIKSALDDIHTLTYPHFVESIGTWLRKEGFAGLDFSGDPLLPYEVNLTMEEMLVIFIYFSFIKFRFNLEDDTLKDEKTYIAIEAIRNFNKFDELDGMIIGQGNQEELKSYLRDSQAIEQAINKLINEGIFIEKNRTVTLADYFKNLLNPGKISDTFHIAEHLPNTTNFMTMFIVKGGYVVMQTVDPEKELASMSLKVYPSTTDLAKLMSSLCPNAFPNGFGDEAKYKNAMKKNKFCSKCGVQIKNEAKFCHKCGHPIG